MNPINMTAGHDCVRRNNNMVDPCADTKLCPMSAFLRVCKLCLGCRTREADNLDRQITEEMAMRFNSAKVFREISTRTSGKR